MSEVWQQWERDLVFGEPRARPGTAAYRYPALTLYERRPTAPGSHLQRAAAWEATARDLIHDGDFEMALEFLHHAKDIMLEGWDEAYDRATARTDERPRLRLVAGEPGPFPRAPAHIAPKGRSA